MMQFIKDKVVWILTGLTLFGATQLPITEMGILSSQKDVQDQELSKGHYKFIPRMKIDGTYESQTDEYQSPKGNGYTITLWKHDGDKTYMKVKDYGKEGRDLDWTLIEDNSASTSPLI